MKTGGAGGKSLVFTVIGLLVLLAGAAAVYLEAVSEESFLRRVLAGLGPLPARLLVPVCLTITLFSLYLLFLSYLRGRRTGKEALFLRDLSETKTRTEEALRETERSYHSVLQYSPFGLHLYRLEKDGRLVFEAANPAADKILGVDHGRFIGKTLEEAFPPLTATEVPVRYRDVAANGTTWETQQIDYQEGEIRGAFEVHAFRPSSDHVAALFLDISERFKLEMKLRELNLELEDKVKERTRDLQVVNLELGKKNEELAAALKNLSDTQGQLLRAERLTVVGQLSASIAHELNTPLGAILSSSQSLIDYLDASFTELPNFLLSLDASGRDFFRLLLSEALPRSRLLSPAVDRQKRKDLQSRLEAAGFENALRIAESLAELRLTDPGSALLERLKEAESAAILSRAVDFVVARRMGDVVAVAAEKAAAVVAALRSYLRQDSSEPLGPVDVEAGLETVLTLLHGRIKHGVRVERSFAGVSVLGSAEKLSRVWMNLINNAVQAMEYQGILTLKTERCGDWVVVSVTDSGPGVSDSVKDRIFEPFFTTKKHGEGLGLGLEICRRIVEGLGGRIDFESRPGSTSFRVRLRACEERTEAHDR